MRSAKSYLSLNIHPFYLSYTSSSIASYSIAKAGKVAANISTTFIGRSSPDEEVWKHTPRSQDPTNFG